MTTLFTNPPQPLPQPRAALPRPVVKNQPARRTYLPPLTPAVRNEADLSTFIQEHPGLPAHTAVLGVCDDHLPVLFDLSDAESGAPIVLANARSGKTMLLQTWLRTAFEFDRAGTLRATVIASRPEEWSKMSQMQNCSQIAAPGTPEALAALSAVVETIQQRLERRGRIQPQMVFFDDLAFLPGARTDFQLAVDQILRLGPQVNIWPMAALSTGQALEMGRWVRHFRVRVLGNMPNSAAMRLGAFDGLDAEGLIPRRQFAVRVSGAWMSFQSLRLNEDDRERAQKLQDEPAAGRSREAFVPDEPEANDEDEE